MKVKKHDIWINGKGQRVLINDIVPKNLIGELVTYPVKATIILNEKPRRTRYDIFSPDGISDVVWDTDPMENLMTLIERDGKEIY